MKTLTLILICLLCVGCSTSFDRAVVAVDPNGAVNAEVENYKSEAGAACELAGQIVEAVD